jgi:hypothetical protein
MDELPPSGSFAWLLDSVRLIMPFRQKGKLHLYDIDDALIEFLPDSLPLRDALKAFYEPLADLRNPDARKVWDEVLAEL